MAKGWVVEEYTNSGEFLIRCFVVAVLDCRCIPFFQTCVLKLADPSDSLVAWKSKSHYGAGLFFISHHWNYHISHQSHITFQSSWCRISSINSIMWNSTGHWLAPDDLENPPLEPLKIVKTLDCIKLEPPFAYPKLKRTRPLYTESLQITLHVWTSLDYIPQHLTVLVNTPLSTRWSGGQFRYRRCLASDWKVKVLLMGRTTFPASTSWYVVDNWPELLLMEKSLHQLRQVKPCK